MTTETDETKRRARAKRYSLVALLAVCSLPRKLIRYNLTSNGLMTMGILRAHRGTSMTQTDMCRELGRSTAALTQNIDHLEKLQYVRRVTAEDDRRKKMLVLTERGEGVLEEMVGEIEEELMLLLKAGL